MYAFLFWLRLFNLKISLLCFHSERIFQKKHDKLFNTVLMTHPLSCFVISCPLAKASRASGICDRSKSLWRKWCTKHNELSNVKLPHPFLVHIGLAEKFVQVFHTILWKNPDELFGQPNVPPTIQSSLLPLVNTINLHWITCLLTFKFFIIAHTNLLLLRMCVCGYTGYISYIYLNLWKLFGCLRLECKM